MLLPITLTIAGAAAIVNLWLGYRTSRVRLARKIMVGTGGDPLMESRMRAQANFIEYTPLFLILLGLIEAARGPQAWLWGVAIAFVVARIAHAFGMDRPAPNPLRAGGILVTFVALLALAGYALSLPYMAPATEGVVPAKI